MRQSRLCCLPLQLRTVGGGATVGGGVAGGDVGGATVAAHELSVDGAVVAAGASVDEGVDDGRHPGENGGQHVQGGHLRLRGKQAGDGTIPITEQMNGA